MESSSFYRFARSTALSLGLILTGATLSLPSVAQEPGKPVLDNERVSAWEGKGPYAAASTDFVTVPLDAPGTASYGHKGEVPDPTGARAAIIELKDHPVAPQGNPTKYPLAFPRPGAVKLLENDRVVIWSYRWNPGQPTVMHFHDKDTVVVYQDDGSVQSTTEDGKTVTSEHKSGDVTFNARNRTHFELLVKGAASAVIVELK